MYTMSDGTRIHTKKNGTFDAEVIVQGEVVWSQTHFSNRQEAQRAADSAYEQMKQKR